MSPLWTAPHLCGLYSCISPTAALNSVVQAGGSVLVLHVPCDPDGAFACTLPSARAPPLSSHPLYLASSSSDQSSAA